MEKTTVLIIEDEKKLLKTMADFLEMHGYQVYTADNGLEGIGQFKKHSGEISCVLLDVMLPFMDGNEVLVLVTELTVNAYSARFIGLYGSADYQRHNEELMLHERQDDIMKEIEALEL